jgi:hypothetical protein
MESEFRGSVTYPKHPGTSDEDHYQILLHHSGEVDLTAMVEGMDVIRRYKASADDCPVHGGQLLHVPEPGELPPSHIEGDELDRWLERQRRQSLLDGEE